MTASGAHSIPVLTADEAIKALTDAGMPVGLTERVSLFEAYGRVLAQDVTARFTVPPADNSAMDGYALRAADLGPDGGTLPVTGRVAAGHVLGRPLAAGEAVRIFTGAPIPDGADTVVPQENVVADDGRVCFPAVRKGANVRPAGEDFRQGDVLLKAGKRLLPQDVGQAASAGYADLLVHRRPVVALFATGDEVREPEEADLPGTIINSNAYVLAGLLQGLGCECRYLGILPDDPQVLRSSLSQAVADGCDALLTSGGVSLGEEDHVKTAVEALGRLDFWRISIRPGRPLAFGRVGDVPFIGLPGNPVAAMVTFLMFARPFLQRLCGTQATMPVGQVVPMAEAAKGKKAGRREWLRGSLEKGEDGVMRARPYVSDGSGVFSSVVRSGGLIQLHEDMADVKAGDSVLFLPFADFMG